MPDENNSRDDIFEDERSRLKHALKSCRNVVANYRVMLEGQEVNEDSPEPKGQKSRN